MLVLSRRKNESIVIDENIVITVVDIRGDKVRLGIECSHDKSVHREGFVIGRDELEIESAMSPEERGFIAEIHDNPYDDTLRLIYADWLEDQGDPRAEYVRLECQLAELKPGDALFKELRPRFEQLRSGMNSWWMAEIGRTRIQNCGSFTYRCPQRWERLAVTDTTGIRKCDECGRIVFYCKTAEEARRRARLGHCIALDSSVSKTEFEVEQRGGLPAPPEDEIMLGLPVFPDDFERSND